MTDLSEPSWVTYAGWFIALVIWAACGWYVHNDWRKKG